MRIDKLTSRLQVELSDAQSVALGKDNQFIEPVHLIQVLLDQNGSASALLRQLSVDVKAFRQDVEGFPKGGFNMQDGLTREETLKGMTIWAAYSNFEENEKGSIEVGKNADFIMLDRDIMKVSDKRILKARIVATILDGNVVYSNRIR